MKKFIGKTLTDIVLVGSVDNEEKPVEVSINHEYLYLEFDGQWVQLSSVNQASEIKIEHKGGLDFSFEIDEDDEYMSVSIRDVILIDTISEVTLSNCYEYEHERKLKALELELENGQSFFIDATYYTGIKVGSEVLKSAFIENHEGQIKNSI